MELPLFPISSVLFPGGTLRLRVFEPRYLELVSHCLKADSNFGISLIKTGTEVGNPATCYNVGTMAKIIDWGQDKSGLLEIEVRGICRFQIQSDWVEPNLLKMAEVTICPEAAEPVPDKFIYLAEFLEGLMQRVKPPGGELIRNLEDAVHLGYRLAEFLPLGTLQRQSFLEINSTVKRLELLSELVEQSLSGKNSP